jgi:hypothetical protein
MASARTAHGICAVGDHSFGGAAYELPGGTRCLRHAITHVPTLRRSAKIALVVGTVLFAINQFDVVVGGGIDAIIVAKIALTYCVPFAVATYAALASARSLSV